MNSRMSRTHTVLLVEDNPDDEELTKLAFGECPFPHELVVVRNGQDALDYLAGAATGSCCVLPQLMLLDLKLPKMSGLEVLRRLRADANTMFLPVVILTSSREKEDLTRSYSLGANSYIQKPVSFNQFIDTVRQLGVYWLGLNETTWTCCE